MDLARVRFVLDKVRHPDNLGSALRALKNSGLSRIALADPHTREFDRARRMATDAEDLLDGMEVAKDLSEAVASATLVAGTTSRAPAGRPTVWLRDFVAQASTETDAGGEVAFVFGNEQRGLSDAELDHCHIVVNIPTAPQKPSINLAQSVMLAAHECYLASLAPRASAARPPPGSGGPLGGALRQDALSAPRGGVPQPPEPRRDPLGAEAADRARGSESARGGASPHRLQASRAAMRGAEATLSGAEIDGS